MARPTKIDIQTDDTDTNASATSGGVPDATNGMEPEPEAAKRDEGTREIDLADQLAAARAEAADNYDRYLRASAELENVKKRTSRDMAEFRKYSTEAITKELLPVVDNLERAIESAGTESEGLREFVSGVDLVLKELLRVLDRFSIRPIEAVGKPFDPTFHPAVMQQESDDHPDNTVMSEFQKGYMIHDRLLRPAMVVVARSAGGNDGGRDDDGRSGQSQATKPMDSSG